MSVQLQKRALLLKPPRGQHPLSIPRKKREAVMASQAPSMQKSVQGERWDCVRYFHPRAQAPTVMQREKI